MITIERLQATPTPGTDEALLAEGFVTVTPIVGIREVRDDAAATALAKRLTR
jgi:5'-nucleotidase